MNKLIALTVLALAALPVQASPQLAAKSKCMSCHQVDKKVLGPSFKEIAAKYKGQANAEAMLADGIVNGVKGKWGKIPMPAQKIPAADATALSKWILTL
ncbi:MAG: c-type cytochrome [Pseudomonadota bacterium]